MDGPFMICRPLFIPLMILFFKLNIYVISPKWDFCIAFLIVFLAANYIISKLYERNNRREQVLKHFKKTLWGNDAVMAAFILMWFLINVPLPLFFIKL